MAVPTGLYMAIPPGYEGQIRGRSGLALQYGISLANGVGTIDADYRGEVKVLLINLGSESYQITYGERIAQIVFQAVMAPELEAVEELPASGREAGGFGSTGG
jgi:dUTP pyrophosphatase